MVAPLGNRPLSGEVSPGTSYGSGSLAFTDTNAPAAHISFADFLGETGDTDLGSLMAPCDLFEHRLARSERATPVIELIADPEPVMDEAEQAELLAGLMGNIRKSMASDAIQPVTEDDEIKKSRTLAQIVTSEEVVETPVIEAITEVASPKTVTTGYSLRQEDLSHRADPIVTRTEAVKAKPDLEDLEPEVLIATEVRTEPQGEYEPIGKQKKERVRAVSFSAKTLVKNLIGRLPKSFIKNKSFETELVATDQSRKLSRNQKIALGVTAALGLFIARDIMPNGGSGEGTLFGKSPNTTVEVEVATGAWSEQIPTVMRWEQDVIRLIKEYDAKAIETNRINEREKRPGVVPYGAVDSGFMLSLMAAASGGNQFATDKNADPSQPDKIPAGLLMISREAGRKVVTDFEPTNPMHSISAGIAYSQALMSMVPENDAKDRPSLITSALQGKQANKSNTPYPVTPILLDELVKWVAALDSEWHLPKNQHAENWLKDPVASARLQLAVNEAKESSLASSTTATQRVKKK